jgi:hypothetical protein
VIVQRRQAVTRGDKARLVAGLVLVAAIIVAPGVFTGAVTAIGELIGRQFAKDVADAIDKQQSSIVADHDYPPTVPEIARTPMTVICMSQTKFGSGYTWDAKVGDRVGCPPGYDVGYDNDPNLERTLGERP